MNDDLWAESPEIQRRIKKIEAEQDRLRIILGVEKLTWEQRVQAAEHRNLQRQREAEEQQRRLMELEQLRSKLPVLRPLLRRPQ